MRRVVTYGVLMGCVGTLAGVLAACGTGTGSAIDRALEEAGSVVAEHRFLDPAVSRSAAVRTERIEIVRASNGDWKATVQISRPVLGQVRVVAERIVGETIAAAKEQDRDPRDMDLVNAAAANAANENLVLTSAVDIALRDQGRVRLQVADSPACIVIPENAQEPGVVVSCEDWKPLEAQDEVAYEVRETRGEAVIGGVGFVQERGEWVKDLGVEDTRVVQLALCPGECADGIETSGIGIERRDGKVRGLTSTLRESGSRVEIQVRVEYEEISGVDLGVGVVETEEPDPTAGPGEINDTTPARAQAEIVGRRMGDTLLTLGTIDQATLEEVARNAPGGVRVGKLSGGAIRAFDATITVEAERFCVRVVLLVDVRTDTPRSSAQATPGSCK